MPTFFMDDPFFQDVEERTTSILPKLLNILESLEKPQVESLLQATALGIHGYFLVDVQHQEGSLLVTVSLTQEDAGKGRENLFFLLGQAVAALGEGAFTVSDDGDQLVAANERGFLCASLRAPDPAPAEPVFLHLALCGTAAALGELTHGLATLNPRLLN